jgi:hypothetical protein
VVALQGGYQQQGHEDEKQCSHGSNYVPIQFVPRVAFLTMFVKFLPYW